MLAFLYHLHNPEEYSSKERSLRCKNISYRPLARKQVYLVFNPYNWESIILWFYAAINTPLTCRECNLFICRGKPVFSIWVSDICLFGFTAPPDGWRLISELLGMLCIPSVQFLLEMKTRVYTDAISVCCRAQGMLTADAQQVPLKLCASAWDY